LDIMKYGLMLILISLLLLTTCDDGLGEEDSYVKVPVIYGASYDFGNINMVFTDSFFSKDIVSGFWNPKGITIDKDEDLLFWTDWSYNDITRYDLRKKEYTIILSGLNNPEYIDFDPVERMIYWCESGSQTVNRSNEWGGSIETLLSSFEGVITPIGISLDIDKRHIYFTDDGTGEIKRSNLDGSGLIIVTGTPLNPNAIAYNKDLGKIYWNDVGSDEIWRSNSDGSNQELINSTLSNPKGLAFDDDNRYLYFSYNFELHRCNLDGSQDQLIMFMNLPSIVYGHYFLELNNNIGFLEFPSLSF
jgi:sugar lactone lactonase YvrE